MIPHLSPEALRVWHDPQPKLLVPSCDQDRLADAAGALGLTVLLLAPEGETLRVQLPAEGAGPATPPRSAPAGLWAAAGGSPRGQAVIKELRQWLVKETPGGDESLQHHFPRLADTSAGNLAAALWDQAVDALKESAAAHVDMNRQVAQLRADQAVKFTALGHMQWQLHSFRRDPLTLGMASPPGGRTLVLKPGCKLVQPLPLPMLGFAGIDLHVAALPEPPPPPAAETEAPRTKGRRGRKKAPPPAPPPPAHGGRLDITLRSVASRTLVACWVTSGSMLARGWNRFLLKEAAAPHLEPATITQTEDVEILVEWKTGTGTENGPALSLSPVSPWPEMCVRGADEASGACLALLGWTAPSGKHLGGYPFRFPIGSGAGEGEGLAVSLPFVDLYRVRHTIAGVPPYLEPQGQGLRCKILRGCQAGALFELGLFPGVRAVTACAGLRDAQCPYPVDVAVAVIRHEYGPIPLPDKSEEPPPENLIAWTGWQRLVPTPMPQPFTVELPAPLDTAAGLYLAVRPAEPVHPLDYWVEWSRFVLNVTG